MTVELERTDTIWLDEPVDTPPVDDAPVSGAAVDPVDDAPEPPAEDPDVPFRPSSFGPSDRLEMVLAAVSGLAFAWALCLVMDWSHPLTFAIWAIVWFVAGIYVTARARTSKVVAMDRLVTTLIWLSGAFAVAVLGWMIVFVLVEGIGGLVDDLPRGEWIARIGAVALMVAVVAVVRWRVGRREAQGSAGVVTRLLPRLVGSACAVGALVVLLPVINTEFFTSDIAEVGPLDEGGGIYHALIGTLEQITIATVISVPIAILTAIYLHEIKGRLAVPVRFIVDAMSGLPSIVAGLIVFTVWVNTGRGFSGASAGVALAIIMIPIVTRTAEEILRTIDDGLRESALALGAPQWRSVVQVVLPTARAGLITASILGVARAIGETAPVLLTAFGSAVTNYNPFSAPQADLPLFIWGLLREPNEAQIARAWSAAVVLLLLVLVLFITARVIGERGARKRTGR